MDLNTSIIGAILIAICIVPFVIISHSRKKRERKILQSLTNLASQQNCTISQHAACGNFVIGIDEVKKAVFFLKTVKENVIERYVNLSEIQKCKVKNTSRSVAMAKGSQNVIEKVELSFIPNDKNRKEISFEFFDADNNQQLNDELQLVEQWASLINANLKAKSK